MSRKFLEAWRLYVSSLGCSCESRSGSDGTEYLRAGWWQPNSGDIQRSLLVCSIPSAGLYLGYGACCVVFAGSAHLAMFAFNIKPSSSSI